MCLDLLDFSIRQSTVTEHQNIVIIPSSDQLTRILQILQNFARVSNDLWDYAVDIGESICGAMLWLLLHGSMEMKVKAANILRILVLSSPEQLFDVLLDKGYQAVVSCALLLPLQREEEKHWLRYPAYYQSSVAIKCEYTINAWSAVKLSLLELTVELLSVESSRSIDWLCEPVLLVALERRLLEIVDEILLDCHEEVEKVNHDKGASTANHEINLIAKLIDHIMEKKSVDWLLDVINCTQITSREHLVVQPSEHVLFQAVGKVFQKITEICVKNTTLSTNLICFDIPDASTKSSPVVSLFSLFFRILNRASERQMTNLIMRNFGATLLKLSKSVSQVLSMGIISDDLVQFGSWILR